MFQSTSIELLAFSFTDLSNGYLLITYYLLLITHYSLLNSMVKPNLVIGASLTAVGAGALIAAPPAAAEINIVDALAQNKPTVVEITPGQTTAVNFQNQQTISYLKLSDESQTVYSTNAPVESGVAQSVFLTAIEKLDFPGAISSSVPNLFVVAVDKQGRQQQYEFVIKQRIPGSEELDHNKINIVSAPVAQPKPSLVIKTDLGDATPDDIRLGLQNKVSRGELALDSTTALLVAEAIAISLNENKPMLAIAKELQIPLALLSELGRTGLAQKAKYQRALPVPPSSLAQARRLLIEENSSFGNEIDTTLGIATIQDLEFGIEIMKEKGLIEKKDAQVVMKIIGQTQNQKTTLALAAKNPQVKQLLSKVGRLGLAFEARQRILGTLN
jgi:hypothetical protein